MALLNAKALDTDLIAQLAACSVPGGTQAALVSGGILTETVVVIEGPQKGCTCRRATKY
jgi:hypothetical protein